MMKKKKHIPPFATILFLSLLSLNPFFQKERSALSIGSPSEMNISYFDKEDEGKGVLRVKLYTKPNPPKEDLIQKRKQDELLAMYHQ